MKCFRFVLSGGGRWVVLVVSVVLVIIVGVVGSPPDCGVVTVGVVPPRPPVAW